MSVLNFSLNSLKRREIQEENNIMKLNIALLLVIVGALQLETAEIGTSRIIGGKDVKPSDWSFMVSLQNYTEISFLWQKYPVYQHFCAGTITTATKIVTAGELSLFRLR